MPNYYKNKRRSKPRYQSGHIGGSGRHNYDNDDHDGNRNVARSHHAGGQQRKLYIKPSLISTLEDEEIHEHGAGTNGYQNGAGPRGSGRGGSHEHRKSNKDRRRNVVERLKEMGVSKAKLSIGDTDNEAKKALPVSQPHCRPSHVPEDVFGMIVNYVQNYFNCFDTNREGLLGAYNPKCTFSLALNMSNSVAYRSFKFDEFAVREGRNLKRIVGNDEHHREKRFKLQHKGYIDTLSVLCKLPPTEHEPKSFKLDLSYFSPVMITFSLSGVFREGKPTDKVRPYRSFHRVFVCIPDPASQMTIVNEQFTISHITSDQYKLYYSTPSAGSTQPAVEPQPVAPTVTEQVAQPQPAVVAANGVLTEQQNKMIAEFSAQSRLNHQWSKYCLEHVNWNFEEAARAFVQFRESIPSEAFTS